jgi:hypothetical protein
MIECITVLPCASSGASTSDFRTGCLTVLCFASSVEGSARSSSEFRSVGDSGYRETFFAGFPRNL